jgi:hypothetical protein
MAFFCPKCGEVGKRAKQNLRLGLIPRAATVSTTTRMKFLPLLLLSVAATLAADKKHVLMIAGRPSHGPGEHEHNAGVQLLAKCLQQGAADLVDVKFHLNAEWPSQAELDQADTIVVYSDGEGGQPALKDDHTEQLAKEMKRGCGFVCLHYAVEPIYHRTNWPDGAPGPDGKPRPPRRRGAVAMARAQSSFSTGWAAISKRGGA